MSHYLTITEASEYSRFAPDTLRRKLRAGEIRGMKRHHWRLTKEAIDDWLREPEARLLELARKVGMEEGR